MKGIITLLGGLVLLGGGLVSLSSSTMQQDAIPAPIEVETKKDPTPARFSEPLPDDKVRCMLCFHHCIISPGMTGICRVRKNHQGRLYTLVYGRPVGLQSDPIEAEPMYHMIPGHRNLGVFTASCNFRCKQCHNWHITQRSLDEIKTLEFTPEEVVAEAIRRQSRSISHTINEPTIFFEFMYDIAKVSRREGLLNLFHTNGGIASDPLRAILRHMDGVVVDLKAFCDDVYRDIFKGELAPVLTTLKIIREAGVHLEIVNLMIPTINDCMDEVRAMCEWIVEHLGPNIPLHFNRFQPAFKMTHLPPTPVETLQKAHTIARKAGIDFVTIGNIPGHRYNNTFCPACNKKVIHRVGMSVLANHIEKGKCTFCAQAIPGVWE